MDIITTYNPANTNLTPQELSAMKDLTDEQIAELAKAYPNQPTGNAYLEYWLKNEKETEQRYPLGTWANLNNLRKLGRKDILPYRFRKNYRAPRPVPVDLQKPAPRIVDLSEQEVKQAEGLKVPVEGNGGISEAKTISPDQTTKIEGADLGAVTKVEVNDEVVVSPEILAAEKELQQAIDDKAHHMTIKSLQAKVDALKQAVDKAV